MVSMILQMQGQMQDPDARVEEIGPVEEEEVGAPNSPGHLNASQLILFQCTLVRFVDPPALGEDPNHVQMRP